MYFFNVNLGDVLVNGIKKCHSNAEKDFFHRIKKLNTPVTKYLLCSSQKYDELLPGVNDGILIVLRLKNKQKNVINTTKMYYLLVD